MTSSTPATQQAALTSAWLTSSTKQAKWAFYRFYARRLLPCVSTGTCHHRGSSIHSKHTYITQTQYMHMMFPVPQCLAHWAMESPTTHWQPPADTMRS